MLGSVEMSSDDLSREINAYEDERLVEIAWRELDRWSADDAIKQGVREDIEEAESHLNQEIVLHREGRSRLRRFIFNVRRRGR